MVFFPNGSGGYNYIYQYTDHLGNVRLSYAEDPSNSGTPTIIEENNYYPFGLKHKGYNNNISPNGNSVAQRWKYNVMELDESLGLETYDFGARNYDPALGRWMNIDPLAEYMRRHSPYTYAYDNPVAFIDPDGMLSQFAWGSAFGISTNVLGSLYSESEAARQKKERKRIYD
ncbi:MAG: RHS repeat-associated core domain-containing protein, partial [Bacteroidota bacterium]